MTRIALALPVLCVPALARDNGQYESVSPDIRQWFRDQKSPMTGALCCDEADGSQAQEDIRNGHYWTTWPARILHLVSVPDEVVIKVANKIGHPLVWSYFENGQLKIRCYAPGGGV